MSGDNGRTGMPACFDSRAQWDGWREAARVYPPGASGYCYDCTQEYQRAMKRAKRCQHPTITFEPSPEGELVGVLRAG